VTKAERECIIRYDDEEREVSWYSCFPAHWKDCEAAGWRLADECRDKSGRVISREYVAGLDQLDAYPRSSVFVERRRARGVEVARRNFGSKSAGAAGAQRQ
jgi:hypothetical protein